VAHWYENLDKYLQLKVYEGNFSDLIQGLTGNPKADEWVAHYQGRNPGAPPFDIGSLCAENDIGVTLEKPARAL